jgi:uncharacterized membrane protein
MEAKNQKKKRLLAASIAGLIAVSGAAVLAGASNARAAGELVPCYGINACKGTGECGGKASSCAGNNACKGQGFLKVPKDACSKIQGGKLTAE